jgi:hypothetical protein
MAKPEAVARVLTDIIGVDLTSGKWLADLQGFNSAEQTELCDAMRSEGVGLADRSKIRILATAPELQHELWTKQAAHAQFVEPTFASPRQLQQSGGSMDSIALALTALLGIASYLVQAKISRDAEQSQKDSDRTHADNARAEIKAEKLLARVQVR